MVLVAQSALYRTHAGRVLRISRISRGAQRRRYPASPATHADLNTVILKHADKGRTGELTSLIRIHDLWKAVFQNSFFQDVDTGICRQAV